jgi:hypothetical protein
MNDAYELTDLELIAVSLVEEPVNPDCGFRRVNHD